MLARGLGACRALPCRVMTTADMRGPDGRGRPGHPGPSGDLPLDLHGLAAAAGVVTARGGPTSHAAVVARARANSAVVGIADLTVDVAGATVRAGGRTVPEHPASPSTGP